MTRISISGHRPTLQVLSQINRERQRQARLNHAIRVEDPSTSNGDKLMVLGEEFGEVSRASYEILTQKDLSRNITLIAHLKDELIQLAAVATAWAESIDV